MKRLLQVPFEEREVEWLKETFHFAKSFRLISHHGESKQLCYTIVRHLTYLYKSQNSYVYKQSNFPPP